MLIRYKKNYEKIAMGLLSYVPSEKDIKLLLQTIRKYESQDDWQLFLWKDGEDIIGVIGIHTESAEKATIEHLSVNPSFRAEGVGKRIISALMEFLGDKVKLVPSAALAAYYQNCFHEKDHEEAGR
ncbi:GNAT family N-acetyltransferase [Sporolactobacillus vineae]|uniref:GNAT family N-acetyltransferase n=1 Tax=Sporolactobacillus vineae TaxID=444463 RepID=UPI000287D44B|nr:GNAT family N-acetyltransferase [Sporolactobacillus vineae]